MRIPDFTIHPRKGLFAAGAVLMVVLTGFLAGYARQPVHLSDHAAILLQAILEEDGATILRYVHPVERELNDLTPETTAAIVRDLINARYEAWGWTAEGGITSFGSGRFSALALQAGRIPGVGRVRRSVQVWRFEGLEDGRPMISLSELIREHWGRDRRWEMRRQGHSPGTVVRAGLPRALLDGFDRSERRMTELGFRYYMSLDTDLGRVSFMRMEDLRKVMLDWVADPEVRFGEDPHAEAYRLGHLQYWMTADQAREHKRQASREDQ